MAQIFLSIDSRKRACWLEAFPGLIAGRMDSRLDEEGLVWVLQPQGQSAADTVRSVGLSLPARSLVLLADEPTEEEAMAALAAGAAGYCNGHAAPEVLRQVAMVVENGGIWVGRNLMQRFLVSTARALPEIEVNERLWRTVLTPREQDAAVLVAQGASNKEIARRLDITERTVKSHVSAMLEKLGARDRLQLSLIINGIEKRR